VVPSLKVATAANCRVVPAARLGFTGETEIDTSVAPVVPLLPVEVPLPVEPLLPAVEPCVPVLVPTVVFPVEPLLEPVPDPLQPTPSHKLKAATARILEFTYRPRRTGRPLD
jgi:hypothetical protein